MSKLQKKILAKPAHFMALVAALTLGSAYIFQYLGYAPCDLCWYQRYPYIAIIGIMFLALALRQTHAPVIILIFSGLAFLDTGLAAYHVGVEQQWWQGPSACTASGFDASTITLDADSLYSLDLPIVRCDEIAWSLAGISMAGYNMIIATGLGIFGVYAFSSKGRRSERSDK